VTYPEVYEYSAMYLGCFISHHCANPYSKKKMAKEYTLSQFPFSSGVTSSPDTTSSLRYR